MILFSKPLFPLSAEAEARLKVACEFLASNAVAALVLGKNVIDGDNLYINVMEYTTHPEEGSLYEVHEQYIDVQCVLEGEEYIGVTDLSEFTVTNPYNSEGDCALGNAQGELIKLSAKRFIVLMPDMPHAPGIMIDEPKKVRKAVAKVKV